MGQMLAVEVRAERIRELVQVLTVRDQLEFRGADGTTEEKQGGEGIQGRVAKSR